MKLWVGPDRLAAGEGNGPVNALDAALRAAERSLRGAGPHPPDRLQGVLDSATTPGLSDTGSVVRVLVDFNRRRPRLDHDRVSPNIIEASWQALTDGIVFGLLHADR